MRPWRRRKEVPSAPVVLPSLDRLAGLIERVVELVDEVSGGPNDVPQPAPDPQPARAPEPVAAVSEAAEGHGWLAFVASPDGYTLVPQAGAAPSPGDVVELNGIAFRALRQAASPLPADDRRCVVVEREEPPEPDRSFAE